jgi:hypothetical protein
MNATFFLTKDYEQITMNNEPEKQTQTNPIKANLVRLRRVYPPLQKFVFICVNSWLFLLYSSEKQGITRICFGFFVAKWAGLDYNIFS